jgi:23S rRNA (adenine2503-C2)-methyltransferase
MPIAKKYSLSELIAVLEEVQTDFKRTFTLEYILIKGFNDTKQDAEDLCRIASRLRAKINVIGYNRVEGVPFASPDAGELRAFVKHIRNKNIPATLRISAGDDIAAACGQLRHRRFT